MNTDKRITGIGYCGMDYLCVVPHIPVDDKVEVLQTLVQGGGPAVTAIAAAARLGARTAFAGTVGDDERGRQIVAGLVSEGIDVSALKVRRGAESPVAFCWIEKQSGKRSIAWGRGTAAALIPAEIDEDIIKHSRILHLDGHQTEAAVAAAGIARRCGVTVSIDAGTIVTGIERLMELSDIIIASEKFACRYTGLADINEAVRKLYSAGCRFSAVTMGNRGSMGFDGGNLISCPAFKVDVADTTGAGDVFHGAFIFEYSRGKTWAECMRFASAVAALKCTKFGGRTGIPDLQTAENFLRTQ